MALIELDKLLKYDEIISHVFFNAISNIPLETLEEWRQKEGEESKCLELILTVNGLEVDVEKFFDVLYEQHEQMIRNMATKIVKEQTSEKLSQMISIIDQASQVLEYAVNDINWDLILTKDPPITTHL